MWLPELYNRMGEDNLSLLACNVKRNITYSYMSTTNSTASTLVGSCKEIDQLDRNQHSVYLKTFFIALSNIPGAIVAVLFINKLGRRNLLCKVLTIFRQH